MSCLFEWCNGLSWVSGYVDVSESKERERRLLCAAIATYAPYRVELHSHAKVADNDLLTTATSSAALYGLACETREPTSEQVSDDNNTDRNLSFLINYTAQVHILDGVNTKHSLQSTGQDGPLIARKASWHTK